MTNGDRTADDPLFAGRKAQMFPQLTAAQTARLEAHGIHRPMSRGEILNEPGDRNLPMFVVLSGSIEVIQSGMNGESVIVVHTAGSFTGEMSTLQGIGSLVRLQVGEPGEVLAINENGASARLPQSFETNRPGIFAVGDVRCGSVKRVAAAVGEGSACVQ
jgi:CRP-like cAMP-binding protein